MEVGWIVFELQAPCNNGIENKQFGCLTKTLMLI